MTKHEIADLASCCRISARMLEIADSRDHSDKQRDKFQEYNKAQANLLWEVATRLAEIADKAPNDQARLIWANLPRT